MTTPRRILAALTALAVAAVLGACSAKPPTADPTTPSDQPTVSLDAGEGIVVGAGPIEVRMWSDSSCPWCAALEESLGGEISDRIDAGEITFVLHPMTYVSEKHGDETQYSTRAAALLFAAADAGQQKAVPKLAALLLENQPKDGSTPPTDEAMIELAKDAGVTADLSDAIATYSPIAQSSNDHWQGEKLPGSEEQLQGVPTMTVDGTLFPAEFDGADLARFAEALGTAK